MATPSKKRAPKRAARNYSPEPQVQGIDPPRVCVIPADFAGLRLDQALARLFPEHSRSRLQICLKAGTLRVDGVAAQAKRAVLGGERVEFDPPNPEPSTAQPQSIHLDIVFEDAQILVINKPPGLVVHPGAGNPDGTLLNALLAHAPALAQIPRAGIVHRLDKDTSGLLVVAKTLEAQTHLVRQLQARTMGRTYTALVHGAPRSSRGVVDAPIGRDPRSRTRMAVTTRGKPARTAYTLIERIGQLSLLACKLESGRTHQIRVHLQSIGLPLVGDPVYRKGARTLQLEGFARQALHAAVLELDHPKNAKPMRWESPLPEDFLALLAQLRATD